MKIFTGNLTADRDKKAALYRAAVKKQFGQDATRWNVSPPNFNDETMNAWEEFLLADDRLANFVSSKIRIIDLFLLAGITAIYSTGFLLALYLIILLLDAPMP